MNQIKVGKFIAECRKKKNLTQEQLSEKLNVSDRAVSKWERGLNLPDASLMLDLSKILDISVNELLSGEVIKKEKYMNKAEENLIELQKLNEEHTKRMLLLEWVIGFGASISFFILIFAASFAVTNRMWQIIMITFAIILFFIGMFFALLIEQKAGYYECGKCHNKYVPTYMQVLFAMHVNRTRFMKCPKCHKRSWNKKVINK